MTVTLWTNVKCPSCRHPIRYFCVTTVRVNKRSMRETGNGFKIGAFESHRCPGCGEEIPRDGALDREPYRLDEKDAAKVAEYRLKRWGIEDGGVPVERVAG